MAMRSSPNGLGLNAEFLEYLWTVHRQDFWAVSDSPKTKILGLFLNSPELNCEIEFRTVHAYEWHDCGVKNDAVNAC